MTEPDNDDFGAGVIPAETLVDSAWWDEEPEKRHTVPSDATPAEDPEAIAHLLAEDARLKDAIKSLEIERDMVKDALAAIVDQGQAVLLPDNRVVRWVEVERKGYAVAPSKFWTLKVGYE